MARPPRVSRAAAGLPRRSSGRPRRPPQPIRYDAACLCEGTERGLRAGITVDGDHKAELIELFWADHTGGRHTPVAQLPDVQHKGDPKW